LEAAAKREVFEETNLIVEDLSEIEKKTFLFRNDKIKNQQ